MNSSSSLHLHAPHGITLSRRTHAAPRWCWCGLHRADLHVFMWLWLLRSVYFAHGHTTTITDSLSLYEINKGNTAPQWHPHALQVLRTPPLMSQSHTNKSKRRPVLHQRTKRRPHPQHTQQQQHWDSSRRPPRPSLAHVLHPPCMHRHTCYVDLVVHVVSQSTGVSFTGFSSVSGSHSRKENPFGRAGMPDTAM